MMQVAPLPILDAPALLNRIGVDPSLFELRKQTGLDEQVFNLLVQQPLFNFAEMVQLAPASESHHHAGPGGLLAHTLEVATLALRLRRGYQLPLGGSLQEMALQRHLWTYAVFVGCLLHDSGKLAANTRLIGIRQDGSELSWTPHSGGWTQYLPTRPLVLKSAKSKVVGYRIEFRKTPYKYHQQLALTHFALLLPQEARTWLMEAPNIMQELLAWLWGDQYESGTIGEIIEQADRESTAKNLQLPATERFSQQISAIERYLSVLRKLIQDGSIKINLNGGMGWVDNTGHLYVICRSLAETLIKECNNMGLRNLPQDPVRVYDILQEHGYALPTPDGKAIWTISVKTESFDHKFTCLKFEARRLTQPSRPLRPLEGEITLLSNEKNTAAETAAIAIPPESNQPQNTQEAAPAAERAIADTAVSDTEIIHEENPPPINTEMTEETAIHAEAVNVIHDTAIGSIDRDCEENSPDTGQQAQETAIAAEADENLQETAVTRTVSIIQNLSLDDPGSAEKFLSWLQRGLVEKTILLNNLNSEIHIVEEGVFLLAPAIFKTFLRLHGLDESKHNLLSKRLARLRVSIRNDDLNIHTYWVKSKHRASAIKGWLLPFNQIYQEGYPIPKPNKYITKELA